MFSNAKLIINYSESKTKVSINNIVNVKMSEWRPEENKLISSIKKELCQLLYMDKILVKTKSLVNTHLLPLINKLIY